MLYSLVELYRRFGGIFCFHFQARKASRDWKKKWHGHSEMSDGTGASTWVYSSALMIDAVGTRLHGVISGKPVIFVVAAVRTSDFARFRGRFMHRYAFLSKNSFSSTMCTSGNIRGNTDVVNGTKFSITENRLSTLSESLILGRIVMSACPLVWITGLTVTFKWYRSTWQLNGIQTPALKLECIEYTAFIWCI
jgi:hypothetical protein